MQLTWLQRWQMYGKLSPFHEAEGSKHRTAKFHVSPERCAENPRLAEH